MKELEDVKTTLSKLELDISALQPNELADQTLVTMSFSVKSLGRLNQRFFGVCRKLSDKIQSAEKSTLAAITTSFTNLTTRLLDVKAECTWLLMKSSLVRFVDQVLGSDTAGSAGQLEKGLHDAVQTQLQSRAMTTAISKPSDLGFGSLIQQQKLAAHDAKSEKIIELREHAVNLLGRLEYKDAEATAPVVDIFKEDWVNLFNTMNSKIGAFSRENVEEFCIQRQCSEFSDHMGRIASHFARHIEAFMTELGSIAPWLRPALESAYKSVQKNEDKSSKPIAWPKDFQTIPDKILENMAFAQTFLESPAAEAFSDKSRSLHLESCLIVPFLTVGEKRRDLGHTMKSKSTDRGSLDQRGESLCKFLDALENALEATKSTTHKLLHSMLLHERESAETYCQSIYELHWASVEKFLKKCHEIAVSPKLQLDAFYATDDLNVAEINSVTNSQLAMDYKAAWTPLVNAATARDRFFSEVDVPKYKPAVETALNKVEEKYSHADAQYAVCKHKICELVAARALARPLKDSERKKAAKKASSIIATLDGELPTRHCLSG